MRKKPGIGVRDAACKLGISLKYCYDLVHEGKLPARKVARQWRIPLIAIKNRIAERGR